jgi:hypothetical protein
MLLSVTASGVAVAQPRDDAAADVASEAMFRDYPKQRYTTARKKLQRALEQCGRSCSKQTLAELHRDLGVIYFAQGRERQGRQELKRALELDPKGRLEPELATSEVSAAFRELGGELAVDEPERDHEPDSVEETDTREQATAKPEVGEAGATRNWLSLSVQQDWLFHDNTRPACGSARYACFDGTTPYAGAIWPEYGNKVDSGVALGTTRLLLGFDHVFGDNLALGVRLGFALGGGPTLPKGSKFLPLHAELRASYFFGRSPFEGQSLRPYLALGGGLADVRGKVRVDFWQDATAYNAGRQTAVDAWRAAGRTFVAPTLGLQIALGKRAALSLEGRALVLFGQSGWAPALGAGFAQGF